MLQNKSGYTDYIKSIEALEFDEVLLPHYFKCINNDLEKLKYFDELESLYKTVPNFKNRLNDLSIIDINSIDFDEFKNKENNMPVVSKFLGIIITMYWNEHNPPHFHAKYGEYKIIVHIKTGVIEGKFPKRALKMVMEWAELYKDELLADWELCAKREMPEPISPLE